METVIEAAAALEAEKLFEATWKYQDFRVNVDFAVAKEYIKLIGCYNEFKPEKVNKALDAIDEIIPTKTYSDVDGRPNVNNGKRDYRIYIGREGSPVIYIERGEYRLVLREEDEITDTQIEQVKKQVDIADCDEVTCDIHKWEGGRTIEFRFWWD